MLRQSNSHFWTSKETFQTNAAFVIVHPSFPRPAFRSHSTLRPCSRPVLFRRQSFGQRLAPERARGGYL